jgi:hypothetical protein
MSLGLTDYNLAFSNLMKWENDMTTMVKIQGELHAPKGQTNAFGKYKYRSCEDIVEAVKPVLAANECWLNITDEMVMLGDRFYVKATASVMTGSEVLATASAYAREAHSRKGMDDSQLTGATSSYARKYALNGLLAIDDTKDADSQDNSSYETIKNEPVSQNKVNGCYEMIKEELDADAAQTREADEKRICDGMSRLNNSEQIAVLDKFGKDKPEGCARMYRNITSDILKEGK